MTTEEQQLVERLRQAAISIRNDGTPAQVGMSADECDEAADTITRLVEERDEARKGKRVAEIGLECWGAFYASLHKLMETDTPAEAKVKRQALIIGQQADRIRNLRAEIRRMMGHGDRYAARWPFTYQGIISQNSVNFAKFRASEAKVAELQEALKPFAKAADVKLCGEWRDDERFGHTDITFHLTFGDLRAARRALEASK